MESCDDPYKILALNIVSSYSDRELSDILHSAKMARRQISKEVKQADFYGNFVDCIMTELVKQNRARQVVHTLEDTVEFFYRNLDIPRLRTEVTYYCTKFGRHID